MATITPTATNKQGNFVNTVTWDAITHSDTGGTATLNNGLKRGSVIFAGTFDGNTDVTLTGSINGVDFAPLKDKTTGGVITTDAAASFEFETLLRYLQVSVTGTPTADDVNVYVAYLNMNENVYG